MFDFTLEAKVLKVIKNQITELEPTENQVAGPSTLKPIEQIITFIDNDKKEFYLIQKDEIIPVYAGINWTVMLKDDQPIAYQSSPHDAIEYLSDLKEYHAPSKIDYIFNFLFLLIPVMNVLYYFNAFKDYKYYDNQTHSVVEDMSLISFSFVAGLFLTILFMLLATHVYFIGINSETIHYFILTYGFFTFLTATFVNHYSYNLLSKIYEGKHSIRQHIEKEFHKILN